MGKNRLEAFSDGVIAIIITIMVLEMKVPHGTEFESLTPLIPVFFSYVLSFTFVGVYWNNHHHMLHAAHKVNGRVLWANMHLLFWLSLIPFVTGWMGENNFATIPVALYGVVMLMAGIAYYILTHSLINHQGRESALSKAIGKDRKGVFSVLAYVVAIPAAFYNPAISLAIYVGVAAMWFVPDSRIEKLCANWQI
jgi:uncharacterized membrane protein